ncbi:unnamed protein product [Aphanomyces euteiches]|uniref:FYVE-type domain-containing protein n=1 Tax=Aphanomyces euteiches TaxID=100861 RepID=A0A6G0XIT3_9STRA|nr:hypothetical protein Ae201684_004422 [Aphanomyces euteiches]KAH9151229.1 hypothetical protein AeRB84_006126 [Aphanomyces euteiches]
MAEPSVASPRRPLTPIAVRPSTPTSPAMDGSPGQRVLGSFFPDDGQDSLESGCPVCQRPFSLVRFKHRCKACDRNVCNDCSKSRLRLDDMGLESREPKRGGNGARRPNKSRRVCDPCARRYFENKLEAEPNHLESSPLAAAICDDSSLLPRQVTLSPPRGLLRRRHFAFFALFSFMLFLRLLIPRPSPSNGILVLGGNAAIAVIHRLTRLDVFGVGLLLLIALDEWLYFQRIRSVKKRTKRAMSAAAVPGVAMSSPEKAPVIDIDVQGEADTTDQISLDRLSQILGDSAAEGMDLSIVSYLLASVETAKLLVCFGKATAFAGSTVSGYISSIETNLNTNGALSDDHANEWRQTKPTLRSIVAKEVDLGLATAGGKKHPSVSRSVLRLIWFLDFVETIMRVLVESTSEELGSGVSKAYESTLGTRHPWLIRKGVMTALSTCPTKTAVLAPMSTKQPDVLVHLGEIQKQMKLVIDNARAVLGEKELLDIK